MTETILFVDDDIRIVRAFQRALHKDYDIEVAAAPKDALDAVLDRSFAVVVSDLNMPGMNGIEFLRQVNSLAPHTIGILLTGWADLEAAIEALNDGLICAEKDLLRDTLIGAVAVLMDLLAMTSPETFGRTRRIRRLIRDLSGQLKLGHLWELEAAGLLSLIGCLAVPPEVLSKYFAGTALLPEEERQIRNHPAVAYRLICPVSRLSIVAQMIQHQMDSFHGTAVLGPEALRVAIGSQVLRVATDFDRLAGQGLSCRSAAAKMRHDAPEYNPQVLDALDRLIDTNASVQAAPQLDLDGPTALLNL